MLNCKPVNTPYVVGEKLKKTNVVSDHPYQELIGSNYIALGTWPDISRLP